MAKVKTGCTTCRIRKVKCDEHKPVCQKCTATGRVCDGYESRFRNTATQRRVNVRPHGSSIGAVVQPNTPFLAEVKDVELLNRHFSTKTLLAVDLNCHPEAQQILRASQSDISIRHALSALRNLRGDLETSGDGPASIEQPSTSHQTGVQQYAMALDGLACSLSHPSGRVLKSALLCCQLFISIEQARKNYAAMSQHIIRGLNIMHQYRARPCLDTWSKLVPAYDGGLPYVDVFTIKLFSAPCKFAEPPTTASAGGKAWDVSRDGRKLAPDIRAGLVKIAAFTLEFLDRLSQAKAVEAVLRLRCQRLALLDALDKWLTELDLVQTETRSAGPEPLPLSFSRMSHRILKIVLLGSLESSPTIRSQLQTENEQLQTLADMIGERVRDYITCTGTGIC